MQVLLCYLHRYLKLLTAIPMKVKYCAQVLLCYLHRYLRNCANSESEESSTGLRLQNVVLNSDQIS